MGKGGQKKLTLFVCFKFLQWEYKCITCLLKNKFWSVHPVEYYVELNMVFLMGIILEEG